MAVTQPQTRDPLLTCREVADLYAVHVKTVRRWVRKGIIAVVLVGPYRLVRIRKSEAARHFRNVPGVSC